MAAFDYLLDIVESERTKVLAINDQPVTDAAKDIAYYSAMLNAAEDDPLDEEAQTAIVTYLKTKLQASITDYQELVNDRM